jgi:hypothetical protein
MDFYDNLTDEERKAFAPRVVIRWLSTLSDNNPSQQYAILAVNDLVNLGLWSLQKHPELIYKLCALSGTGKKQYHQWIPQGRGAGSQPRLDALIQEFWPQTNSQERDLLKKLRTPEQWMDFASQSGIDDRHLKDLKDEFKKIQG